jgi:cytochrome c oxidase subunit 1
MSIAAFVLGAAQLIFVVNFFWSLFRGPVAGRNPWNSNTLEWTAPSPPPHGNFEDTPIVYRWPYDYNPEGGEKDHSMQNDPEPPPGMTGHEH